VIPAATVTLQPLSRPLQISQVITADPAQLTADVAGGVIPARIITHTIAWTGETAVGGMFTTSDRQRLRGQALQGLQTAAWDQLTGRLSTGVSLLDGSLRVVEINEEVYSTANDAMAGSLALYLRATVAATIVEMPLINGLVYQGLLASLPAGFELVPATIQIGEIQFVSQDSAERITFTVNGRAVATAKLDVRPYLATISGRPVDEANAFLAARLPLQDAPSIALRPAWWAEQVGRLPYRPARIVVEGDQGIE
jgi:hypothetical protein